LLVLGLTDDGFVLRDYRLHEHVELRGGADGERHQAVAQRQSQRVIALSRAQRTLSFLQ
jgi:hypothetical protein